MSESVTFSAQWARDNHTADAAPKLLCILCIKLGLSFPLVTHRLQQPSDFYHYHLALTMVNRIVSSALALALSFTQAAHALPQASPSDASSTSYNPLASSNSWSSSPSYTTSYPSTESSYSSQYSSTTDYYPMTTDRYSMGTPYYSSQPYYIPLHTTRCPRRPTHPRPHLIFPTRRQGLIMANPTITTRNLTRHLPCAPCTILRSTTRLVLSTALHARTSLTVLCRDSRRSAITPTSLSLAALSTLRGTLLIAAGAGTSLTR